MLFFADKVVFESLTFNYKLLMPYYSEVLPCNFKLSSWFNRYIKMNIPVLMLAAKAHNGTSIFNIHM